MHPTQGGKRRSSPDNDAPAASGSNEPRQKTRRTRAESADTGAAEHAASRPTPAAQAGRMEHSSPHGRNTFADNIPRGPRNSRPSTRPLQFGGHTATPHYPTPSPPVSLPYRGRTAEQGWGTSRPAYSDPYTGSGVGYPPAPPPHGFHSSYPQPPAPSYGGAGSQSAEYWSGQYADPWQGYSYGSHYLPTQQPHQRAPIPPPPEPAHQPHSSWQPPRAGDAPAQSSAPRTRADMLASPTIRRHQTEFAYDATHHAHHSADDFRLGTVIETVMVVPNLSTDKPEPHDRRYVKSALVGSIDGCFRRAVVVRRYADHMLCLYISTAGGRGVAHKSRAVRDAHLPVVDEGRELECGVDPAVSSDYLVVRARGKGKEQAPGARSSASADMHANSFVILTRPFPVDYVFAIRVLGELTDASRGLLLERYELLSEKGLQEPTAQRGWQASRMAHESPPENEDFLPHIELRSASKQL